MRPFSLRRRTARGVAVLLSSLALAAVTALPANAGNSITATINILVRSVTVSPSSIAYVNCTTHAGGSTGTGLAFPNGQCTTMGTTITITNGPADGHIDVQGADAIPADNGAHWTLCSDAATACSGGSNTPGADQFQELTAGNGATILTTSPQCDDAFDALPSPPGCTATAGQTSTGEWLSLTGPSTSSDSSTSFTTVVTWTAVP